MNTSIRFLTVVGIAIGMTACEYASDSMADAAADENGAQESEIVTEWLTSYEKAIEKSRETERPILMNFTGSDWCPPCIQMKNDVLDTRAFKEFAKGNLVLLELDFPRTKPQKAELEQQNTELAEKFRIQGFPTFLVVDDEGEEVRRTVGYMQGGPNAFVAWIEG